MPKPKPKSKSSELYTDRELQEALNNSTIALLRWERLTKSRATSNRKLMEFSTELVKVLTEILQEDDEGKPTSTYIEPAELALCLSTAALLVSFSLMPDEKKEKTFINELLKA